MRVPGKPNPKAGRGRCCSCLRRKTRRRVRFFGSCFRSQEFGATAHDAAHGAFMTLPPYTSAREGEVHLREEMPSRVAINNFDRESRKQIHSSDAAGERCAAH